MSMHFQPGSMGANLLANREIEERHRRSREREMVREAKGRPARSFSLSFSLARLKPVGLLRAVRVALGAPRAVSTRQAAEG